MAKNQKAVPVASAEIENPNIDPASLEVTVNGRPAMVLNISVADYDSEYLNLIQRALSNRADYQFGKNRWTANTITSEYTRLVNRAASAFNKRVADGALPAQARISNYDVIRAVYAKGEGDFKLTIDLGELLKFGTRLKNLVNFGGVVTPQMAADAFHLCAQDVATRPSNDKFKLEHLQTMVEGTPQSVLDTILENVR